MFLINFQGQETCATYMVVNTDSKRMMQVKSTRSWDPIGWLVKVVSKDIHENDSVLMNEGSKTNSEHVGDVS